MIPRRLQERIAVFTRQLALLLPFAAGCHTHSHGGQQFTLTVPADDPPSPTMVVLKERLSVHDFPDSGAPYRQSVTESSLRLVEGNTFTVRAPRLHDSAYLLLAHSHQDQYRLTIFRPGHAVLTLYPEGDAWSASFDRAAPYAPSIGWRLNAYFPIRAQGMPLSVETFLNGPTFAKDQKSVTLTIPLRPLRTRRPLQPDLTQLLPPTLCSVDAANLSDQLRSVNAALRRAASNKLDPRVRALVQETVQLQHDALTAAQAPPATGATGSPLPMP
jgi:hypothetical protein